MTVSRIIAGLAGGRRLRTPPGNATRPTSDRVREGLFSALAAWNGTSDGPVGEQLAGQSFLDLFAGSGAVGLEAASRGASRVVCVEKNRRTAALVADNARDMGLSRGVDAVAQAVEGYLAGRQTPPAFDIIWFDPPYALAEPDLDGLIGLAVTGLLADDGLIAVERSSRTRTPVFPEGMVSWANRYGETVVHLAQPDRERP